MPTDNTTAPDTKNAPTDEEIRAAAIAKDDAEFVKIITQRYMYNAEKCLTTPLVGYLLNRLPMPPIKNRAWEAFLIRATRPTTAVDRDGNVVTVNTGEEILIPATFTLASVMGKASTNADFCYEVRIKPTKKIDIGGNQEMWEYDLAAKPNPRKRASFGLAAVLGSYAALPSGAGEGAGDDDIAF
jgi:hypothetical protein